MTHQWASFLRTREAVSLGENNDVCYKTLSVLSHFLKFKLVYFSFFPAFLKRCLLLSSDLSFSIYQCGEKRS